MLQVSPPLSRTLDYIDIRPDILPQTSTVGVEICSRSRGYMLKCCRIVAQGGCYGSRFSVSKPKDTHGPPAHDPRDAGPPFVSPHMPRPAAHGWHRKGHSTGGGEGVCARRGS